MYKYIHTCIYLRIYMSAHIHTYTYIHTRIQNVHMNARKHAWNDGTAANARGAVAEAGAFVRLFRSTQSNHISHLQCKDFIVPTSWKHQYPSTPHPLFPTYPRTVRRPRASAVLLFYADQINRVHSSEEAPRSFTMAPCVVVERLRESSGAQSRSRRARRNPSPRMIKGTVDEETKGQWKNDQALHQPITQSECESRQRSTQTTSAHLHWCGPDPSSSWPAQATSHKGHAPKRGYIFAIF